MAEELDDRTLLAQIAQQRDRAAFNELFSRYEKRAYNLAMHLTFNHELARDAVQEALLDIWLQASSYRPGNEAAWILRIVANKSLTLARRHRAEGRRMVEPRPVTLASGSSPASESTEREELLVALRETLDRLPPLDHQIVALCYAGGMTQEEVGEQLSLSRKTISTRLTKACAEIRTHLEKAGYAAVIPLISAEGLGAAMSSGYEATPGLRELVLERTADVVSQIAHPAASHAGPVTYHAGGLAMSSQAWILVVTSAVVLVGLGGLWLAQATPPSLPAIYYVDAAEGLDSNSGASPETPWKTLEKVSNARASFLPGDSILLKRGGTWNETFNIIGFSGSSGAPITFGAYGDGDAPVIDAQHERTFGLYLRDSNYITVQDLRTTHATADGAHILATSGDTTHILYQRMVSDHNDRHGFNVEAALGVAHVEAIEFRDCLSTLNKHGGFLAYHVSDRPIGVHYYNCKATYSGQASAAHGFSASISNNVHYHQIEAAYTNIDPATGSPNEYYKGQGIGMVFDDFSSNCSVEHSYSHHNAGPGMALAHQADNNTASYNLITNNGAWGLVVNGNKDTSDNVRIFNNTIYGNKNDGIAAWSPCDGLSIKNNIIVNNGGRGILFTVTGVTNYTVATNLIYGNTLGATVNVTGAAGTIASDPQFTNPAGGDFSLRSSSPAVNAGMNLALPNPLGLAPGSAWPSAISTLDQNRNGIGWEIGAYVYADK